MPRIRLPAYEWQQAPQEASAVNRGHPLANRLVMAWAGGAAGDNYVVTPVGAASIRLTPFGLQAGGFGNNVANRVTLAGSPRINGGAWTVLIGLVYAGETFPIGSSIVSQGGSGSGGKGWCIGPGTGGSAGNWGLCYGGVANYSSSAVALVSGTYNVIAVTVSGDGGTARYFNNGLFDSARTVGTMGLPASQDTTIGCCNAGGTTWRQPLNGSTVGPVLLWDRALSDQEVAAVSADPFQVFERPATVWVGTASTGVTGSSSATLALTGSATGTVAVAGASSATLAITGTATAAVTVTGASAATLPLTGTSTATVAVTGASSAALSLTSAATGSVVVSGASSASLALASTATGAVRVTGVSVATLPLTGTATGTVLQTVLGPVRLVPLSAGARYTVRVVATGPRYTVRVVATGPRLTIRPLPPTP